jgi:purine nucleoside phosphorylase
VTGPLTDAQAADLVALVRAAIDAQHGYYAALHGPMGETPAEHEAWDRRVDDAYVAADAAERAAGAAIRALRGAS